MSYDFSHNFLSFSPRLLSNPLSSYPILKFLSHPLGSRPICHFYVPVPSSFYLISRGFLSVSFNSKQWYFPTLLLPSYSYPTISFFSVSSPKLLFLSQSSCSLHVFDHYFKFWSVQYIRAEQNGRIGVSVSLVSFLKVVHNSIALVLYV